MLKLRLTLDFTGVRGGFAIFFSTNLFYIYVKIGLILCFVWLFALLFKVL